MDKPSKLDGRTVDRVNDDKRGRTVNMTPQRSESYSPGARLLFWAHRRTGLGVHELYCWRPFRWAMTLADKLAGKPPT